MPKRPGARDAELPPAFIRVEMLLGKSLCSNDYNLFEDGLQSQRFREIGRSQIIDLMAVERNFHCPDQASRPCADHFSCQALTPMVWCGEHPGLAALLVLTGRNTGRDDPALPFDDIHLPGKPIKPKRFY